jgi:dipeptidyl-peptidase-3
MRKKTFPVAVLLLASTLLGSCSKPVTSTATTAEAKTTASSTKNTSSEAPLVDDTPAATGQTTTSGTSAASAKAPQSTTNRAAAPEHKTQPKSQPKNRAGIAESAVPSVELAPGADQTGSMAPATTGASAKPAIEHVQNKSKAQGDPNFDYIADQFADLRVLRYQVPGFEQLSLKQKELLYYLSQAALAGRDMVYDQNFKHNLRIRRTLDAVVASYKGDKKAKEWNQFMTYAKRVWFSNGIHHHYSTRKFTPEFSKAYFAQLVSGAPADKLPLQKGETAQQLITALTPIIFDPTVAAKRVNQTAGEDLIATSAMNYYEGVTQKEVEDFYAKKIDKNDPAPISYGLNSKLVKENGQLVEKVWKAGGMYDASIKQIIGWLEKAVTVAENPTQKAVFEKLIQFYRTGDLKTFDEYSILWAKDTESQIDVVNGFIEVYGDPLGYRAAYESVVNFRDPIATERIKAIGDQAQWFEDNSTLQEEHKKKNVKGISAKVITVVTEAGDAAPATPIGINLPNATWIRKEHGSKSVSLGNIVNAYNQAANKGSALNEFAWNAEEVARTKQYGALAADLHTDMHEVIGHASGQINKGVGTPKETLKSYASAIEEGRADLVALYYIMDPKLIEIGVMPSLEVGKAEYDSYIRNGLLTQLSRLQPGETIEEAHMRNRAMIANWAFETGESDKIIEKKEREGKTYFVVRDYEGLRELFGLQLRELQRITSEGDYNAAKELIERYGVKVDPELHKEVLARYSKLNIPPYQGFIQPKLLPTMTNGKITDVKIEYPKDFTQQMLEFGQKYNFLPHFN